MKQVLKNLKPERVWFYFEEISKIPRPSGRETQIVNYVVRFGRTLGLETTTDRVGNVLIKKPACKGREKSKSIVLQSHLDMVCEKNADLKFDFNRNKIELKIEKGWVRANGTTLGADDGIGVAAQLAILESTEIKHGPLECLFTVGEETGLDGAFALQNDFLKSKTLINLDSEDEGHIYIGCAGGKDTTATFRHKQCYVKKNDIAFTVNIKGLKGGHSGDDINKGLGNSIKILSRILYNGLLYAGIRIANIEGGNLRNAIPREAFADFVIYELAKSNFVNYTRKLISEIKEEFKIFEPNLQITLKEVPLPKYVIDVQTSKDLINALYACPNGVYGMSYDMPDLVETSTNLASIKINKSRINVQTSQRSSVESQKKNIVDIVTAVFTLADAKVEHSPGYPGWTPNLNSEILNITKKSYNKLFKTEPKVLAIHAGLECGVIGEKFPGMDMISIGPTLRGVHSPDEKIEIASVEKFWTLLIDVLETV